jgi:hypothetical protein
LTQTGFDLELERRAVRRPNSRSVGSTRGAGDERGDDVGGVAIQGLASSVVAHGGARVSVAGCFLDVAQRNAGVERSGDERVPQRVRSDAVGDAGLSGNTAHDAPGGVAVESLAGAVRKDRTLETLADREVEYPGEAAPAAW